MHTKLKSYSDNLIARLGRVEMTPGQMTKCLADLLTHSEGAIQAARFRVCDSQDNEVLIVGSEGSGAPTSTRRVELSAGPLKEYIAEVWLQRGNQTDSAQDLLDIPSHCFESFLAESDRSPLSGLLDFKRSDAVQQRAQRAYEETVAANVECAAVFLDLDGFKSVNDRLGQDKGDNVIRRLGMMLLDKVTATDNCTAYHNGGDEFVLFLMPATIEGTLSLCLTLLDAAENWDFESEGVKVGLSIGAAHSTCNSCSSFEEFRTSAERAMKDEVKQKIKGTIRFNEPQQAVTAEPDTNLRNGLVLAKSRVASLEADAFANPWLNVLAGAVANAWDRTDRATAVDQARKCVERFLEKSKLSNQKSQAQGELRARSGCGRGSEQTPAFLDAS